MAKEIVVYTLQEVANIMKVTRRTVYNWLKAGKLEAFKTGKEWRVTQEALENFTKTGTGE